MGANKAFFILLLSFLVSLIGLATIFIKTVPLMLSHAVYVCQKAFSNVLFILSHSVPLLLITLIVIILLTGVLVLVLQILKTRTYLKKHLSRRLAVPAILRSITQELHLRGRIDIVEDSKIFSFCYGLLRPRVCLSTGLLRTLTEDEVKAVLLHESYHIRNRDPLKILLGKTASIMFFFIPIFAEIQNYYAFSKEIAADEVVMKHGNKDSLISVLSKLLLSESPKFAGVATLGNVDDLEKRIVYLTKDHKKIMFKPSLLSLSLTTFVVLFSLLVINAPVYAISTQEGSWDYTVSCIAAKEVNYSKNLLYTPLGGIPE